MKNRTFLLPFWKGTALVPKKDEEEDGFETNKHCHWSQTKQNAKGNSKTTRTKKRNSNTPPMCFAHSLFQAPPLCNKFTRRLFCPWLSVGVQSTNRGPFIHADFPNKPKALHSPDCRFFLRHFWSESLSLSFYFLSSTPPLPPSFLPSFLPPHRIQLHPPPGFNSTQSSFLPPPPPFSFDFDNQPPPLFLFLFLHNNVLRFGKIS